LKRAHIFIKKNINFTIIKCYDWDTDLVSYIRIDGRIIRGVFRERPNRFLAFVQVKKRIIKCFLPDPGRLNELLFPGASVILREAKLKGKRKTDYDLIGIKLNEGNIVSIDSRVPNKLVFEALKNGDIEELSGYPTIKPEYRYYHSRFDFFLAYRDQRCLLEVKSCTLLKEHIGMFPDAPTKRGRRHIKDLIKARKEGYRACLLFIIQRKGAYLFTPNDETDIEFGKVIRNAAIQGVEIYAYSTIIDEKQITLDKKIKVVL
jgi:sugar fermentation stimulation protein A